MNDVTQILRQIESGDPSAATELLPLVYDELRRLAAQRLTQEKPGQTLQATALVHEAYLGLMKQQPMDFENRAHFFAVCARLMREILVQYARRRNAAKRGGGYQLTLDGAVALAESRSVDLVALEEVQGVGAETPDQYLAIDEALTELERHDSQAGQLFKLRYFAGCSIEEGGEMLGISRAAAYRHWTFARAWILKHLLPSDS